VSAERRTLATLAVLAVLWLVLDRLSDGVFLTPRNLSNLAVQSSVVGILACGMVLVIVAGHIDLSVGSLLGFTGMVVAALQAEWLPEAGWTWPAALVGGLALGAALGAWQGAWVAWGRLPAFVVTLAGLLAFRGAAWLVSDGRTVSPLLPEHALLGGGIEGFLGARWSWALGLAAVAALGVLRVRARRRRVRLGVPVRGAAAEALEVLAASGAILGFVAVMNAYTLPGSDVSRGIPVPVLILLGVALGLSVLARATRFGRHVFALGGSPQAAERAGIDVRRVVLGVFALMGVLCAVAGIVTTARLEAGTSSMGTLAELQAIAAAVLGGTSLAGGVGSVGGAVLGAVVMQTLDNGMVLLGISSPARQVCIGGVLLVAVWLDGAIQRRARRSASPSIRQARR
jgi:D-xylose transport system permease protein